jgi:hypothetical protein
VATIKVSWLCFSREASRCVVHEGTGGWAALGGAASGGAAPAGSGAFSPGVCAHAAADIQARSNDADANAAVREAQAQMRPVDVAMRERRERQGVTPHRRIPFASSARVGSALRNLHRARSIRDGVESESLYFSD